MTYEEAREYIEQSNQYGSVLGLSTITELMRRLGDPQDKLKIIHVAGTNGKGSTTAYLASILASSGYSVGRYISPAVFSYRERIQISSNIRTDYISRQGISDAIATIKPICEAMVKDGFPHPTSFELETAMAFLYLLREQVDYAVIEVGLGGRLDATNVITQPICSVITSISMDHMQYLGDTLEEIAGEKAGIIKKKVPVVTCNTNPKILSVLQTQAANLLTEVTVADVSNAKIMEFKPEGTLFEYQQEKYKIGLLGEHQIANAVLAIETAKLLQTEGILPDYSVIKDGLSNAVWRGRFEVIARNPYFIIDGAHNEEAAIQLKRSLELYFPNRRIIFILGVFADKDYRKILEHTAPKAEVILTIASKNSRALASADLAEEAKKYTDKEVIDAGTAEAAVKIAYEKAGVDDAILAFGSLSFLGELSSLISS